VRHLQVWSVSDDAEGDAADEGVAAESDTAGHGRSQMLYTVIGSSILSQTCLAPIAARSTLFIADKNSMLACRSRAADAGDFDDRFNGDDNDDD
jgi:hypothetical protein